VTGGRSRRRLEENFGLVTMRAREALLARQSDKRARPRDRIRPPVRGTTSAHRVAPRANRRTARPEDARRTRTVYNLSSP